MEIDLLAWCNPHHTRYAIHRPWQTKNGRAVATNGFAVIELYNPGDHDPPDGKVPNLDAVLATFDPGANWRRPAPVMGPPAGIYPDGSPVGLDRYWCKSDVCSDCKGEGCPSCAGDGQDVICIGDDAVEWCGGRIKRRFAWMISRLPDVEVAPYSGGAYALPVNDVKGIQFQFQCGRGLVLGVTIEPDEASDP